MTWYLKYRPQNVSELDLVSVRDALQKYLDQGQIPHAWLFSGPRGIGKTSAARILAKSVNCPKSKKTSQPCGDCNNCLQITQGTAVDVVEIDAASNRGIDEVRDLKEKVRLAPMEAKYKVYIIDEVHMLTTEAANALLKTLEEPPDNTIFILCTTEPEKLPQTVVSRCTRLIFNRPTGDEVLQKLKLVAKGEKLQVEEGVLEEIAREASGSFRDGIKLLEQAAMEGGKVTAVRVSRMLGVTASANPEKFLGWVQTGQRREALELINRLAAEGVNWRTFVEKCIARVREELLAEAVKNKPVKSHIELVEKLTEVWQQLKTTAVPQLPMEIFVLENTAGERTGEKKQAAEEIPPPPIAGTKGSGAIGKKYGLSSLTEKWSDVMRVVKPQNHSVEALLRSTKPLDFDGEKLRLEVFYKFHLDKLNSDKCRTIVEDAVAEVLGMKSVKLYLELGQRQARVEELTADEVGDDIVRAAQEIFKAEVV